MKIKIKRILIITFLLVSFQNLTAQVRIKDLDLKKIHEKKMYQILHSKANSNFEAEWVHFGEDSTSYQTNDTIILTNDHFNFYPKGDFCYRNTWSFVDVKKNHLSVSMGIYLCKEPPGGGIATFNILTIDRFKKDLYINILNGKFKIVDRFKVIKIEFIGRKIKEGSFRLTLLRSILR